MLARISASHRLASRLSLREDERRDIVLRIMNLLQEDDFRRLRRFRAEREAGRGARSFRSWLATLAVRSAISHVRGHPEYLGRGSAAERNGARWVEFLPLDVSIEASECDPTEVMEGHALLQRARSILRLAQIEALLLWLAGARHAEIAERLGLEGDVVADRLVRSALKRLRDDSVQRGDNANRA
jgi:DNA-directed RNA polymerase specialized sigma24 family protein